MPDPRSVRWKGQTNSWLLGIVEDVLAESFQTQLLRPWEDIRALRMATHGSVAEEDAVRVEGHGLFRRVVGRHHRDLAAEGGQAAQDVLLDAKVVRHDLQGHFDVNGAILRNPHCRSLEQALGLGVT